VKTIIHKPLKSDTFEAEQKIHDGLHILAKIIAKEVIKDQLIAPKRSVRVKVNLNEVA